MKIFGMLLASLGLAGSFQLAPRYPVPVTSLHMGFLDDLLKQPQSTKKTPAATSSNTKSKDNNNNKNKTKKNDSWINNMFKEPLHGHGSAEKNLDDMYDAQQKLLEARRQHYGNTGSMRTKYQDPTVSHLRDIPVHRSDPAMQNKKEDDAMYFGDDNSGPGFSFNPFKGKAKP